VPVSGDTSVQKLELKRTSSKRRTKAPPAPARLDTPPVLVSVDIDAGPAKVSRFAGLFFVFVGVCFAAYSLSGMYVELVELSTSNHQLTTLSLQRAQTISSTLRDVPPVAQTVPESTDQVEVPINSENSKNTFSVSGESGTSPNPPRDTMLSDASEAESGTPDTPPVQELFDVRVMQPLVDITVSGGDPRTGVEDVKIRVAEARRVELVLVPQNTLIERYVGRASNVERNYWIHQFDTQNVPNGEYSLFARITNQYGTYESRMVPIRIKNVPMSQRTATTSAQLASSTAPSPVDVEIANATIEFKASEPPKDLSKEIVPMLIEKYPRSSVDAVPLLRTTESPMSTSTSDADAYTEDTAGEETTPLAPPHIEQRAQEFVTSIDEELQKMLELYGVAIRGNDAGAIAQMEKRIIEFESEITNKVAATLVGEGMVSTTDDAQMVRDRIIALVRDERERRAKEERLILERVGAKIQRDSDRDGISDYDEERLYKTDPYVADSDQDGYTDGAEVLSGYDPANDGRETVVSFEDPRTTGIERPDLLEVTRLDVVVPESTEQAQTPHEKSIVLAGKALPYSFVTLYIYSTPIVVTVKTNDDGSWSYTFDKELEDGQHHVYVGVTDNAGKIIAKSKPFAFVKTADAYSIGNIQDEVVVAAPHSPRLMSENVLILTTSLIVIMIGLVLVLIGAYLARRPHLTVSRAPLVAS
jgi:hypothetical protein